MPDREPRLELTDDAVGCWLVTTSSESKYLFNLIENTVERVGGERRPVAAPSDSLQSLRGIINLRVGERGQWWVRNTPGGYTDPDEVWQWSSEVKRIEPAISETGRTDDAPTPTGRTRDPKCIPTDEETQDG
ncbi:hypothetical protein [Leifsonia shinshuensis]|uniref:Uncharacterized protein n=1 Tax=Leifsonia shinshuensis TaxID=150026 RepID=A0A7G6YA51_9MICO|nr:hypothetical protein [Leifsonia shinshuensis]QNE35366.1 hypothetical protein F1C12_09650 [Leifsonia shinshuensis]